MLDIDGMINRGLNPVDPTPPSLISILGIDKLRRAITKELKNREQPGFDDKCSNLPQLISIFKCVLLRETSGNIPFAVLRPFNYTKENSSNTTRLIVDIVSKDRNEWIKVSARNPRSLSMIAGGGGGFGQRSIIDHAREYLHCSEQNYSFFKPPKIVFVFTTGIAFSLARQLEKMGVSVEGELIPDKELGILPRVKPLEIRLKPETKAQETSKLNENDSKDNETPFQFKNPSLDGITKLNLDITALLAYVSNLTNGHTDVLFKTPILSQQLQHEKERPQKSVLEDIFCVGGPEEKKRAQEFLKRITIVPDQMSSRGSTLALAGNIKQRSLMIFGTGDTIEAVTVTANSGFYRSAISQGVEFPVFIHESRALTECKENKL